MQELTVNTPAKINFGLNIIRKRTDGYHDIETIFYPVKLFDTITFIKSDTFSFTTSSDILNNEADNLIIKAVHLLENLSGTKINCNIYLEKNIPMGAGLGGGSSDAAAALKAINELYHLSIKNNKLLELALQLGSDVPYFINPVPAYSESRGEKLTKINFNIPYPLLLVNPGVHVSTKWAYENIFPAKPGVNLLDVVTGNFNLQEAKSFIKNDFEEAVIKKYPALGELKSVMYECGALISLMSGSGSTFFGIFDNMNNLTKAEEIFRQNNYFTFINQP